MRLIDADAVCDEIDRWLDTVGDVVIGKGLSYYGELLGCIEDAPTVDAVPAVHGRWVNNERIVKLIYDNWFTGLYKKQVFRACSVCRKEPVVDNYGYVDWEYCPYCGAKMDEVTEDE